MVFYSHPEKELQVHLNGVLKNALKRGFGNIIIEFVSLFHDIAKTNSNFQNKLFDKKYGYANHSYLSTYVAIYLLVKNKVIASKYSEIINIDDLIKLNIISNIMTKHHGNLKNIDEIFNIKYKNGDETTIENNEEIERLINFVNGNEDFHFDIFLNENYPELKDVTFIFDREYKKIIFENLVYNDKYKIAWKKNPIRNFFDTTFNFAQLIEADKRDASKNEIYVLDDIKTNNIILDHNLNKKLNNLSYNSELNLKRLEIRNEAEHNLRSNLSTSSNRMFEITSPTGSGKTFIMLKLANIIQEIKGDYGIIMTLPFTSIIDQTSDICESDLLLDILNYTSVSNTSPQIEKLMNMETYSDVDINKLISLNFSEETFDHPFILTTFVQFFQTLIGNRNSVLIKLPNFSKRIFLIDEFQSLPSSLYTFYYGILKYFCEKYDCYCILSTATMPNFQLNNKVTPKGLNPIDIFDNYYVPIPLLESKKYYNSDIFNRYIIENIGKKNLTDLTLAVKSKTKNSSVVVVMNTIQDSIDVFNNIDHKNKYLLNSRFAPIDRLKIIQNIKEEIKNNKEVLLVSTQLIEAGVDIDFMFEFRDLCPIPSLIQSSGRCNRNGIFGIGYVYLFSYYVLKNNSEIYRAKFIYKESYDLQFVTDHIPLNQTKTERELFDIQSKYYFAVSKYKVVGRANEDLNLVDAISEGKIEDLGNFRLIPDIEDEFQYYVGDDELWNEFNVAYLSCVLFKNRDYSEIKKRKIRLNIIHKKLIKYCVNIRINEKNGDVVLYSDEIMGIRNLLDKNMYSSTTGFCVQQS